MNHQATPGLLSLSQIRHIIHRFFFLGRVVVVADVSNLIDNILLLADVKTIPCPLRQQMLVLAFFGGFDQTREKGPFSVLFLSP